MPAVLTVTCLTAGIISILMGIAANYPFALAPGMGLNAVVAFQLIGHLQISWPQAMTVVFLEGSIILLLVITRFRMAVMDAIPLVLKRSIGAGIGLFIALIGFANSGLIVSGRGTVLALGLISSLLVTFSLLLSDFFDTMGTVLGISEEGHFLDDDGNLPGIQRVLLVDSLGAAFGGLANASSNATYIESAAGIS